MAERSRCLAVVVTNRTYSDQDKENIVALLVTTFGQAQSLAGSNVLLSLEYLTTNFTYFSALAFHSKYKYPVKSEYADLLLNKILLYDIHWNYWRKTSLQWLANAVEQRCRLMTLFVSDIVLESLQAVALRPLFYSTGLTTCGLGIAILWKKCHKIQVNCCIIRKATMQMHNGHL